jgi:hypothetical protein
LLVIFLRNTLLTTLPKSNFLIFKSILTLFIMSETLFAQIKPAIDAVPDHKATYPSIPISIALQEAEDLYLWCQNDKEALIRVGLNWSLVDDLPARTAACRYVESNWKKIYRSPAEAQTEWNVKSAAAFALRTELIHHFLWAFRNNTELRAKVQLIAKSTTNAEKIQDLSDLAIIGKQNSAMLKAASVDLSLVDQAESLSAALPSLLAQCNNERKVGIGTAEKMLRNKAFYLVKEAVDEIRAAGKYAFVQNSDRYKGYTSQYYKLHKDKSKNNQSKDDNTATLS